MTSALTGPSDRICFSISRKEFFGVNVPMGFTDLLNRSVPSRPTRLLPTSTPIILSYLDNLFCVFLLQLTQRMSEEFLKFFTPLNVGFPVCSHIDHFICFWISGLSLGFGLFYFKITKVSQFYSTCWICCKHFASKCIDNRVNPRLRLIQWYIHLVCDCSDNISFCVGYHFLNPF